MKLEQALQASEATAKHDRKENSTSEHEELTKSMNVNNNIHQLFVIKNKCILKSNFNLVYGLHLKCNNIHIFE